MAESGEKHIRKLEEDAENLKEEELVEAKLEGKEEEDEYAEKPDGSEEKEEAKEEKSEEPQKGRRRRGRFDDEVNLESWVPKTKLGLEVKNNEIKSIDEVLKSDKKILEAEIVDSLIKVESDLVAIGQSKGKFGGGKRRAWRQTQRKTREGNVPTFSTMAVVGDRNGHVGIGVGKSMETLPARDKAVRKAKLNIFKVERGCSAFDCNCPEKHTVPYQVSGKSGSVTVTLIPAPQGTGLAVADQLKKILSLAGIKDVYSKIDGRSRTTFNTVKACIEALEKTDKEKLI